ncbi:MAG: MFS transporter, partial [Gammaproteobacteria bacterium]|nr:MFS transporter [Gammaproteobacteria bacterium]
MSESNQFALLKERRFAGLFYTQFLGAFNDNLFKSALSLIIVYSGLIAAQNTNLLINAAAGLFILPFFLFSATAGQLADKYEKSRLVRIIKIVEIFIALCGGVAVYLQSVSGMLMVLFLLGVQSTFFGPLKFSILPQQLKVSELVGGNAQIEMGTFVAILLGTLIGGVVAALSAVSLVLPVLLITVAVAGYGASRFIPHTPATDSGMKIGWNPVKETLNLVKLARVDKAVFQSILAVSWFWFLGSVFLTQIPNLVKLHLSGGTTVVTMILSVFTISIALGSLACERLSGHKIEIGLVPFGAFGLSVAGVDLYFAINGMGASQGVDVLDWVAFLAADGSLRVLLDMGFIGVFGGLFIVPLYALIQIRTPEGRLARIIAVNNVMNALFMVTAAGGSVLLLGMAGWSIPDLLLSVALLNLAVAIYIFRQVPEFSMRFVIWVLSHTMYRVTHEGLEKIPEKGPAIIVCNHVTFVDALLLAGAVR